VKLLIGVGENENFYWLIPDDVSEDEAIQSAREEFVGGDPQIEFYFDVVAPMSGYSIEMRKEE